MNMADDGQLQIWGFEEIKDVRYHVRHLRFRKFATPDTPENVIDRKLVYDYAAAQ